MRHVIIGAGAAAITAAEVLRTLDPEAGIAAVNTAGGDTRFPGSLAMNVLDTLGLISCSFGQWQGVAGGGSVEPGDAEKPPLSVAASRPL